MGHTSPNPPQSLDKILNVTTEQVWEAIRQLLELRPFVFNNDEGARISLAADKRDVARFEEHAVVQFQRPIQEVVQEMRDIFSYIVRPNHSRFMSVIPSPSSPISCLGEILTSAFNSWPAAWFAVATIETKLIAWLSTQIGMPTSTGGTFLYTFLTTHFSVPKVLQVLGFSNSQMRQLPADSNFRLGMEQLRKRLLQTSLKASFLS
ncbi:pyridoxal phosphate-dependent transferase [Trichoderma asperelloides]|nr:pyridoxal phosphate-dependent transferase [Trichoderma asperelloides]